MRAWLSWVVAAAVIVSVLALTAAFLTAQGSVQLVFGWLVFLRRTLPRVTMDWPSLVVGCAALLLFAAGLHVVGRGVLRARGGVWKARWSIAGTALIALLFTAGVAIVGAIHQIGWLATSREPSLVNCPRTYGRDSPQQLRNISFDFLAYEGSFKDPRLPDGGTFASDGAMLHSWETVLTGQAANGLYIQYDPKKPWNHPDNQDAFKRVHPIYLNPELRGAPYRDADGYGLSHYAANSRVMAGNYAAPLSEMQGHTATTILVGEVNANFKPWSHPVNWRDPAKGINRSSDGFGGAPGSGGANFLMADGSVRFINESTSPAVLRALASPKREDKGDAGALEAALKQP
jgi:prepilin-type processing-associated H-X9-DG protein